MPSLMIVRRPARHVLLAAPVVALLAGAIACADRPAGELPTMPATRSAAVASPAAAPVGATMRFGREGMTGFEHMSPNAHPHTRGGHAVDKVYPGTVAIRAGQTVAFESFPVHQIAIYGPGTEPADIRIDVGHLDDVETPFGTFADVLINDPAGRLALSPISFERLDWTPPAGTFDRPGRYLVICTLVFHYVETRMYGWVEVR